MKRVISLWLPRFATDRLLRRHPRWRGEPFVTAIEAAGRLIVTGADPEAAAAGIGPGLPVADARALVPELRIAPADPPAEARALAALAAWCGRYTPWTAPDGRDGVLLDTSGCAHLFGGEAALLADLTGRLGGLGFEGRAAAAETPGAAWAVARFGTFSNGMGDEAAEIVLPGALEAALAPLPIAALRLAPADADLLHRLGLKRIGDLYDLPRPALARRFGDRVARRLDQALGRVAEPISPLRPPRALQVGRVFAEPVFLRAEIEAALDGLLAELCPRLAEAGLGARRLSLVFTRTDGSRAACAVGTARPAREPRRLARLFAEKLERLDPGFGFERAALVAAAAEPLAPGQLDLEPGCADPAAESEALAPLVDRLANRLGPGAVMRFAQRQSHLPERAVRARPALAPARGEAAPLATGPRPLRLLAPPEPVDAVAPIPDDPPVMFRWRRIVHRIVRADGPERIAPEWWRGAGEAAEEPRDYYRVEDERGRRFWLYRRGLYRPDAAPAWFLHGVFA